MKTYVSFILDETGSMLSVKSQTVSGFNEYLASLKSNPKGIRFTLTKFNSTKVEVVHDNVKLKDVPELTDETYQPYMGTPLYDAIGKTIGAIGDKDNVIIVIQTDGQENASREYTRQTIFDLIKEKQDAGWTFVFLGADMDAYAASAAFGIPRGNTINYAGVETQSTLSGVGMTTSYLVQQGNVRGVKNFAETYEGLTDGEETSD